jgi:hypothetical protein
MVTRRTRGRNPRGYQLVKTRMLASATRVFAGSGAKRSASYASSIASWSAYSLGSP